MQVTHGSVVHQEGTHTSFEGSKHSEGTEEMEKEKGTESVRLITTSFHSAQPLSQAKRVNGVITPTT